MGMISSDVMSSPRTTECVTENGHQRPMTVRVLKMPRKTEGAGGGRKRRLPITVSEEKEKLVPHVIPARKKKAT